MSVDIESHLKQTHGSFMNYEKEGNNSSIEHDDQTPTTGHTLFTGSFNMQ
jgi:hypothetical protein